jgi:hypothetical protein
LERLKGETSTLPGASAETLGKDSHSDNEGTELLKLRNVAVVGISRDPAKPALFVTSHEDTGSIWLAETALKMGHQVSILAYGDGVHGFTAGQKPLAGLEDRRF